MGDPVGPEKTDEQGGLKVPGVSQETPQHRGSNVSADLPPALPLSTPHGLAMGPDEGFDEWLDRRRTMRDADPFAEPLQTARERAAADFARSMAMATLKQPDRAAEEQKLAQVTGLPSGLVFRNFDEVKRKAALETFDSAAYSDQHPATAAWLTIPENAEVAHDDLPQLGGIESLLLSITRAGLEEGQAVARGEVHPLYAWHQGLTQIELAQLRVKEALGTATPEQSARAEALSAAQNADQSMRERMGLGRQGIIETTAQQLPNTLYAGAHAIKSGGIAGAAAFIGANLIGQPELAVPAAIAVGRFFGVAGAAAATGELEAGGAIDEFLQITDVNGKPLSKQAAYTAGFMVGAVNAALETIEAEAVLKALPGADVLIKDGAIAIMKDVIGKQTYGAAFDKFVVNTGKVVSKEILTEVLQEASTVAGRLVAQEINGGTFKPLTGKEVGQRLLEVALATAKSMVVMGGAPAGVTYLGEMSRAQNALQTEQVLQTLGKNIDLSKTRERSPTKFEEYIAAVKEAGGPIGDVGIPVEKWDAYFQSKGVNPEAAAREILSDPKRYTDAKENGANGDTNVADVMIPLEEFTARIGGTKMFYDLLPDVRWRQGNSTANEAREFFQSQAEDLKLAAEARKDMDPEDVKRGDHFEAQISQFLQQTGVKAADANKMAEIWRMNFEVTAAKSKDVTIQQLMESAKIQRDDQGNVSFTFGAPAEAAREAVAMPQRRKEDLSPAELVAQLEEEFQTSHGTLDYTGPERRAPPPSGIKPTGVEDIGRGKMTQAEFEAANEAQRQKMEAEGQTFQQAAVKPQVARAAIKVRGQVFTGQNHGIAMKQAERKFGRGVWDDLDAGKVENGFVDTEGDWLTREQALKRAEQNRQLRAQPPGKKLGAEHLLSPTEYQQAKRPESDIGHKREVESGRYVGSPDWVGASPQALNSLRTILRKLAAEGKVGQFWYEESARSVLKMVGGDVKLAEKFVGLLAIFSQGTEVGANTTFALLAWLQWKAGVPIQSGRFPKAMSAKAQAWLDEGKDYGGIKVNNFYTDLMEEIDPSKVDREHSTMDMWMALAFDYGSKTLDQGPKYGFAQREISRLAAEMGVRPHQAQAMIWTAIKARIESANKERLAWVKKHKGDTTSANYLHMLHELGMKAKITPEEIAARNFNFSHALNDRTAMMSWEVQPGETTGLLPGLANATIAQQEEFLTAVVKAVTDENGKNLIAELAGVHAENGMGFSSWKGNVGMVGGRSLVAIPTEWVGGSFRQPHAISARAMDRFAALLGFVFRQDAVTWHHPVFDDAKARRNGVDLRTARHLTEGEMRLLTGVLSAKFGTTQIAPGYTSAGARILNFVEGLDNETFQRGMDEVLAGLPEDFGGTGAGNYASFRAASSDKTNGYLSNDWTADPEGSAYSEVYADRTDTRRPDLLRGAVGLQARYDKVVADFAKRYGWDKPGTRAEARAAEGVTYGQAAPEKVAGLEAMLAGFSQNLRDELRDRVESIADGIIEDGDTLPSTAHLLELATGDLQDVEDADPKEVKEVRRWEISQGVWRAVTDEELANVVVTSGKKYAFKLDGVKYVFNRHIPPEPTGGFRQGERGQIQIQPTPQGKRYTITLHKNADLSSFSHEMAHAALDIFGDLAARPNTDPQLKADYQSLLKWFGIESTEQITAEHHEMFARGVEAYLREGKSPSVELAPIFARFRAWLMKVYEHASMLNVQLSDEVRGVMDRMFATNEQIAAAQKQQGYGVLFASAEEAKASDAEFQSYTKGVAQADEQAHVEILQRIQDEHARETKEWWREEKAGVAAQVEQRINNDPTYQAYDALKTGAVRTEGGDMIAVARLDREQTKRLYGDKITDALPRGIYEEKGGVAPDVVALQFGLPSADALIEGLSQMRGFNKERTIAIESERIMRAKYGDLLNDSPALAQAAQDAVHSSQQEQTLLTELRLLGRQTGIRIPPNITLLKRLADETIRGKTRRNLDPQSYLYAEARAGKRAYERVKAGDMGAAAQAKRQQLLNHLLYKAAVATREDIEKRRAHAQSLTTPGKQAMLGKAGMSYVAQANALLEQYDFARGLTLKEGERRTSLAEWVKEREANDEPVDVPKDVLARTEKMAWQDLTVDQLTNVSDALKNIEHLARFKNKLLAAKAQRDLDATAGAIGESIRANATKTIKARIGHLTPKESLQKVGRSFLAMHRKIASYVRQMDGGKDNGPMWNAIIRPINRAGDLEASMLRKFGAALDTLINGQYSRAEQARMNAKEAVPGVSSRLSKWDAIMFALNIGNEDSRTKLLAGQNIVTEQNLPAILDTLEKRDWEFVQGIWDQIDSLWPDIKAKQERVFGVPPEKVEATPVITKHGTFRGGYFPLQYDRDQSAKVGAYTDAEQASDTKRGVFVSATTRRGHTYKRIAGVKLPVKIDPSVIVSHMTQVIHDLTHHEMLIDVNRILRHPDVQGAIEQHYGIEVWDQFKDAMEDIAAGDTGSINAVERGFGYLRNGTSIAVLGMNFLTTLQQPLGLTVSMVRIGPVWVARGISRWIRSGPSGQEATLAWIREQSEFMRNRARTQQREMNEILNVIGQPTATGIVARLFPRAAGASADLQASFFSMIAKGQLIADVPTWLGAYEKAFGTDPAMDHETAVALADQAVIDSQGGGQIKDLAAVQRGSPMLKMWTTFYSYGSMLYQQTAESYQRTDFKSPKSIGAFLGDMLLLHLLPASLGYLLKAALRGDEPDKDDWEKEVASSLFNMIVGLREVSTILQTGDWKGPAGARFFVSAAKGVQQIAQGEFDAAFWKSINEVLGNLFHYPATQLQRSIEGTAALFSGRTKNPAAVVAGPPRR